MRSDVGRPNVIISPYKVCVYAETYALLGMVIILVRVAVFFTKASMPDYSRLFNSEKVLY